MSDDIAFGELSNVSKEFLPQIIQLFISKISKV